MAVFINRSTNIAPVSLSTSYFAGSLWDGISVMILISLGTSLPEPTLSKFNTTNTPINKHRANFKVDKLTTQDQN